LSCLPLIVKKGKLGAQDVESLLENQIRIVASKRRDLDNLEDNSSSSDAKSRGGEDH